jgi:hypothetical protein
VFTCITELSTKALLQIAPPNELQELQQRKEAYTYGGHGQEQQAAFLHPHQVLS